MSCCGKRRTLAAGAAPMRATASAAPVSANGAAPRPLLRLIYEYVGASALTLTSPQTGRRYRFGRPGARLEVDARDRPLVSGLSQLRQVV